MSGEEHKPEPSNNALSAAWFSLIAPVAMGVLPFLDPHPYPVGTAKWYSFLTLTVCVFGIVSACWAIPRRPENSRLISNSIQAIGFFGVLACLFVGFWALFVLIFAFHPLHT